MILLKKVTQISVQELDGRSAKHESRQSGSKSSSRRGLPCQHASAWLVIKKHNCGLEQPELVPLWGV